MSRILALGGSGEMGSAAVTDLIERTDHEVAVGDIRRTPPSPRARMSDRRASSEGAFAPRKALDALAHTRTDRHRRELAR